MEPPIHPFRVAAFRLAIGVGVLVNLLFAFILLLPSGSLQTYADDALMALMAFTAGSLSVWRHHREQGPSRSPWLFLGCGHLAFGFGMLFWTWEQVRGISVPFPSLGDIGFMAAIPLCAWALLSWPGMPWSSTSRARALADGVLAALALSLVLWILWFQSSFVASHLSIPAKLLSLAYPVGFTVVLAILLLLWAGRRGALRGPLAWIGIGTFLLATTNAYYAHLTAGTAYRTGHPIDQGWILAFWALGLAPLHPGPTSLPGDKADTEPFHPLWLALPYYPVLVALGVWALTYGTSRYDGVVDGMLLAMMVVLIIRQILALQDVYHLSQTLEAQVAERTEALRRSESELLQARRFEDLGTLSADIASDFGNLLTVMQISAQQLLADVKTDSGVTSSARAVLTEAMEKARVLTQQLQGFARKLELRPATFDLAKWVEALRGNLQALLEGKELELQVEIPENPVPIHADPHQMEQVLAGLLARARDSIGEKGRIHIRVLRLPGPAGSFHGGEALLEVSDNGHGIHPDHLERVFEPFMPEHKNGLKSGLALAYIWGIVIQSGGQISVVNNPGVGTTFRVRLPLAKNHEPTKRG